MDNLTEIALIKKSMDDFKEALNELKTSNSEAHKEIKDMVEKAMNSKAGKWVERVLIGAGSVIGVALLGALLSIIINK
jgi:CHASE3 domain sensor protein